MTDDIVLAKIEGIQRCIKRVSDECSASEGNFADDYTRQDAAVLNLIRACE